MSVHKLAGQTAPRELLVNVPRLVSTYYTHKPDPHNPAHRVAFGTSGHRGSSLKHSFNEDHILATCQALYELRQSRGITGPLYMGMDTHALSEPALRTAVEVFAANGVDIMIQAGLGYTPTPVISHAILTYNRGRRSGLADGVVITPSHNPAEDGGFKYNPPAAGPADTETTTRIQDRANEILRGGLQEVKRMPLERALQAATTHEYDYVAPYVEDLRSIIDLQAIAAAGLKIGVDPMGGAGVAFWDPIAETYGLDIEVLNREVDPTFSFMTVVPVSEPPRVGQGGSCGEDTGLELHDRPRGGASWTQVVRGAGGFQVVRGRAVGRLARLWRGGERRGIVLAPRWQGVDHGQGRLSARSFGRGDHGHDRS